MPDRPSEVATLFPGAFAFAMATGIVAIGAEQQHVHRLAVVLYAFLPPFTLGVALVAWAATAFGMVASRLRPRLVPA